MSHFSTENYASAKLVGSNAKLFHCYNQFLHLYLENITVEWKLKMCHPVSEKKSETI